MTRKQRSKAAAALGRRGGLAWARTRTPEQLRERAMRMVEARRVKRVACIHQGEVGADGQAQNVGPKERESWS